MKNIHASIVDVITEYGVSETRADEVAYAVEDALEVWLPARGVA